MSVIRCTSYIYTHVHSICDIHYFDKAFDYFGYQNKSTVERVFFGSGNLSEFSEFS